VYDKNEPDKLREMASNFVYYKCDGTLEEQKMESFWRDHVNKELAEKREAEEMTHHMKNWADAKSRFDGELQRKSEQRYWGSSCDKRTKYYFNPKLQRINLHNKNQTGILKSAISFGNESVQINESKQGYLINQSYVNPISYKKDTFSHSADKGRREINETVLIQNESTRLQSGNFIAEKRQVEKRVTTLNDKSIELPSTYVGLNTEYLLNKSLDKNTRPTTGNSVSNTIGLSFNNP